MGDADAGGAGSEFVDTPDRAQPDPPPGGQVTSTDTETRRGALGSPLSDEDADVAEVSPLRPNTTY